MTDNHNRLGALRMRHLQLLDQIAERGSLRKAAQALHLTQPAASLMIRDLENAFGAALFQRSRRGMSVTPQADAVLPRARAMLAELRLAAAGVSGAGILINVGALPRVMHGLAPTLLCKARSAWPELRLRILEGAAGQLLSALRAGEVDCVIARLDRASLAAGTAAEWSHHMLYEEGMCLVAGPRHPCASRRRLPLADLLSADWILPPPDTETRTVFIHTFLKAGLRPPPARIESGSIVSNAWMVRDTSYLTIAPNSLAHSLQQLDQLRILPIRVDAPLSPIAFICRRSNDNAPAIARLRDLVSDVARAAGLAGTSGKRPGRPVNAPASAG